MKNSLGYEVIKHVPHCDCGERGAYFGGFDIYGCVPCDKWLEKCSGFEWFPEPPLTPSGARWGQNPIDADELEDE